ncbi:MAG: hypothetical protein KKC19_00935 [Nanoarchaeota archaeon]|nr:hypothetical protein [Nanoarchaeota archaeon]
MLIKLDNPALLSKAIEIISDLVLEVRVKVNDAGMSITATDPANVSMIGFALPKTAFSVFETGDEILGINLDNFKRILKRAGTSSALTLEKKENFLDIQIQDRVKRNFSLSLIDIEGDDVDFGDKMSRLEFSSVVELDSSDFIDSIEDCIVVSDACSFEIKEGKFIIQAKGLNSSMTEFSGDEAKIEAENCKAKYSLEYLQKFIKASKLSEKTILKFAEDHPLRMDVRKDNMEISFVLAPRVETED